MKRQTVLFVSLIVAMAVLLAIAWYTWPQAATSAPNVPVPAATATSSVATSSTSASVASAYPPPALGETNGIVTVDGQNIYVDLAEDPAQQELGLGNRASLGADQGMLFLFPNDDVHMFWMKDMSFSIDMVWLSDNGTVIYIQPNVAPSTYPDSFGPNEVSRYVLELPANFAADHGIKVGDTAILP